MTPPPAKRPRSFTSAAYTGATADDAVGTPTGPPSQLAPSAEPTPETGPAGRMPRPSVVSDIASKQASNIATNQTVGLSDLLQPAPSPELDLVTVTLRLPRYLRDALDLQSMLTRRPRQAIARDCLAEVLDPDTVRVALRKANGL
jgi:hypothetical protein